VTREQAAFAFIVLLIGIFGIAGAVVTMEPRWIAAAEQDDRQRVDDLNQIAVAVMQYKAREKTLPYDVSKIVEAQPAERPLQVSDPDTKRPYEYSRVDEKSYRLCAVFGLESAPWNSWAPVIWSPVPAARLRARVVVSPGSPTATFQFATGAFSPQFGASAATWNHPAGEHCFDFDDRSSAPIKEAAGLE
jgi:hypothetical protein